MKVRIHSFETCGTVDGPGIRFVLFLQGCALRCLYCHNPDSLAPKEGTEKNTEEVFREILKYKSYMFYSQGGVTFTGGEPLMQAEALKNLILMCRQHGIHTAIDTNGYPDSPEAFECLALADLVLLDIKAMDSEIHLKLTQVDRVRPLEKLDYLEKIKKPTWIRYVLVPGWNDTDVQLNDLGRHLQKYTVVEKVQILPLHHLGAYKWEQLGKEYHLKNTPIPTVSEIQQAHRILAQYGLNTE